MAVAVQSHRLLIATVRPLQAGELWDGRMNSVEAFKQYWPFLVLGLWFAYKWWNSKKVLALLPELKRDGAVYVDVRSAAEFAGGNAPGTINIPLPELGNRLGELPKESPVVLCCASGTRSGMAKLLLKKNGYPRVYNIGPWTKFLDAAHPK
jgi:phage shock protein E